MEQEIKNQELDRQDLRWALRRCPDVVLRLLKQYPGKVFVAGGYIRACVASESVADVDLFVPDVRMADACSMWLEAKIGNGEIGRAHV